MKLNNKALMTSAGIGLAIRILFALCGGALGFAALAGINDLATLGILATVGTVICLCGWIVTVGVGFAYVWFAKNDGPVEIGEGAAGGAAATAIAGLIGGLLSACLALVQPFALSQGGNVDVTAALTGAAGNAVLAVCIGVIGGAILGAIGGAIGAATVGKPK